MKRLVLLSVLALQIVMVGCSSEPVNTTSKGENNEIVSEASNEKNVESGIETAIADNSEENANEVMDSNNTDDGENNDNYNAKELNSSRRVLCWGTSLTHGTGGGGVTMPNVLERLSGATVLNYGGYAENTNCIATRSGASEFTISKNITIPTNDEPVEVEFSTEFGDIELILKYTDAGLNPVTIDGISGNLYVDEEDGTYYFTRIESGEEKEIAAGSVIVPYSVFDRRDDDINVIWTAGNDNLQNTEDIQHLIEKIDKMIEHSGSDNYIVVSEMNKHEEVPVTDEVNSMFEDYYGEHFVNFRRYLIEDAFDELNLTPSTEDLWDISVYEVPSYFIVDDVHGNSLYYYLAGKLIYEKCQELGYLY